jgi:hypothetical protein
MAAQKDFAMGNKMLIDATTEERVMMTLNRVAEFIESAAQTARGISISFSIASTCDGVCKLWRNRATPGLLKFTDCYQIPVAVREA